MDLMIAPSSNSLFVEQMSGYCVILHTVKCTVDVFSCVHCCLILAAC